MNKRKRDNVYCLFCGATPTESSEFFPEIRPQDNNHFYKCKSCGYTWCISCVKRGGGDVAPDMRFAYCPRCPNSKMSLIYKGSANVQE